MSTEKAREEFEAAWADAMRGDDPPPGRKPLRSQIDPERYRGDAANFAWRWWQRSREALVIERPEKCEFADPDGPYHKGYRQGMRNMVDAVESAGLRVTP